MSKNFIQNDSLVKDNDNELTKGFVYAVSKVKGEAEVEEGADPKVQQVPVDRVWGQTLKFEIEPRKGEVVIT